MGSWAKMARPGGRGWSSGLCAWMLAGRLEMQDHGSGRVRGQVSWSKRTGQRCLRLWFRVSPSSRKMRGREAYGSLLSVPREEAMEAWRAPQLSCCPPRYPLYLNPEQGCGSSLWPGLRAPLAIELDWGSERAPNSGAVRPAAGKSSIPVRSLLRIPVARLLGCQAVRTTTLGLLSGARATSTPLLALAGKQPLGP